MTRDMVIEQLRSQRQKQHDLFGNDELALFGSYARDTANEESDIDLAVLTGAAGYFELSEAQHYLEEHLHTSIDIGYFRSFRPFFKKRVEKEMIRVW